jgi:hypothetical protein
MYLLFEKRNSLLEGDRMHPRPPQPSLQLCPWLPSGDELLCSISLATFQPSPEAEAAMQGILKLFLDPVLISFSTGSEIQGLKVARPRGCQQGQSPRQAGQEKDEETFFMDRKKCPEAWAAVDRHLLRESSPPALVQSPRKMGRAVPSKKRLGQIVSGELVKNRLPAGRGSVCV